MNILQSSLFRSLLRKVDPRAKRSYSQCGEDILIRFVFDTLGVSAPTYVDIGANDPVYLSNTYAFYLLGGRGVCVDPDPRVVDRFRSRRPRDRFVQAGVGLTSERAADLYIMEYTALSTFDRQEAESIVRHRDIGISDIIQVPLLSINDIYNLYLPEGSNLLSIDIEGLDYDVLASLDFGQYRPEVICIETIQFISQTKITKITDLMHANGYMTYADTYINTLFVNEQRWKDCISSIGKTEGLD